MSEVKVLKSGSEVNLKINEKTYVQNPVPAKGWPCGNIGPTAGSHKIIFADDSNVQDNILNNSEVKIICVKSTHEGYNRMYSAKSGNIYYDIHRHNHDEQVWIIQKVGEAKNDDIIKSGDKVIFKNKYWKRANLSHTDNWLSCENDNQADEFIIVIM